MNNELLDEIIAAYKVHNLRPIQGSFFISRENVDFACPLTALALHRGFLDGVKPGFEFEGGVIDAASIVVVYWSMGTFGQLWVRGFLDGFDGQTEAEINPDYLRGFELGVEVAKQLFPSSP